MKKIVGAVLILFFAGMLFSVENDTNALKNELLQDKTEGKVIIPDVKLSIEDESEVPLKNQTENLLKDNKAGTGKIDMDELSRTKESDRFKAEMTEIRKKEDFSLSAFKFYYGLYENLVADINIGKRAGNLNYLLTYLRNKRASIGLNTNIYYNTELDVDDLNLDMIYSAATNLDISGSLGYYVRNIGLYTNTANLSEAKQNIPFKLGVSYNIDMISTIKADADFQYLALTHKITDGYQSRNLWEAGAGVNYDINWSRDNYLRASAAYDYSSYETNTYHYGRLSFTDKFGLTSYLAVLAGADVHLYSYKDVFWSPNVGVTYKITNFLVLRAGLSGEQTRLNIDKILPENQIDYRQPCADEKWVYYAGASYIPYPFLTVRGSVSYQNYWSYLNYQFDQASQLYYFAPVKNIGVLEADGSLEWLTLEALVLTAEYKFRQPLTNGLLFFYQHSLSAGVDYKYTDWGFEASTRLTYKSPCFYFGDQVLDGRFIWDITLSKTINKDIFAELKVNNILNQKDMERPDVPGPGITFQAGIRILL